MAKVDPSKLAQLLDDAGVGKVTRAKVLNANDPPKEQAAPKGRRRWGGGHGAAEQMQAPSPL